ncbi:hypothetical protein HYZ99_01940 [Candidatus Peregrinibacteria bacterium]|nr:hypothetical protein [Candidatus Peregrinibacteria bacterium]
MKKYNTFIFEEHAFDPASGTISLHYSLDGEIRFTETLIVPMQGSSITESEELDRALFALHLAGGASYYKTCCPKQIELKSGSLTKKEADFWNAVYENGLGEFFFKNKLDFRGLISFPSSQRPAVSDKHSEKPKTKNQKRILIPVGGGKDSIVTIELLKAAGFDCTLLRMGHHPVIDRIAEMAGLPLITVDRHLSPALFDLNAQGALNGHIPITAYLSFVSLIVAMLHDFDAVALSNERSANIGNVSYLGREINHQWSKSAEFERLLRTHLQQSIGTDIEIFSALRPFSELSIVERFTTYPQYFALATSCNKNWKILRDQSTGFSPSPLGPPKRTGSVRAGGGGKGVGAWCGTCPKCAFVFSLYAAFLPKKELERIFGSNFFDRKELEPLYRELLGLQGFKPFECVGTPEETKAAFLLAHKRGDLEDTAVMKMFVKEILPGINDPKNLVKETLESNDNDAISKEFPRPKVLGPQY